MMAVNKNRSETRPVSLKFAVLSVLLSAPLGVVALRGLAGVSGVVKGLLSTNTFWGPWASQTMLILGANLLMLIGGVLGVMWLKPWKVVMAVSDQRDEDHPETLTAAVLSVLLAFLALMGLSAAAGTVGSTLFGPRIEHSVNWLTLAHLALFLLIGGGGLWGLVRLKPWARREPISPAIRKTNTLFGISGLLAMASCLVLVFSTWSKGHLFALFSNTPVALWVAGFAIACWLLSWAIAWWWYFSADEHEQRASDVGLLLGGLLFAVVTPAWWVAARAGLLPQPNAMVLWLAVNLAWTIGWFWRRNR